MKKARDIIFLLVLIPMLTIFSTCQHIAPSFEVISLDIIPPKVTVGERTTIRAELRNGNATLQTYNVPLMVNGVAQDRKTVTLSPGATEVVEFSLVKYKAGSYKIGIGDQISILEVQKPSPPG